MSQREEARLFDYPYDEIAAIVGKTPDNCRQILAREHRHVEEGRRPTS